MTDPLHDFTDAYDEETKRIVDQSDMSDGDKDIAHSMLGNSRRYETMRHVMQGMKRPLPRYLDHNGYPLNPLRDGHPQESNEPREDK